MKIVVAENPRRTSIDHCNDVANAPLSASLNSGYALAVSREAGWDTAYLDFANSPDDAITIADTILAENADIVLFHWVYTWGNEEAVRTVIDHLKKQGNAYTGAFGLFPTLSHERLHDYVPKLDFIIVGEFERTLHELLDMLKKSHRLEPVAGLALKDEVFLPAEVITDISSIPTPDDVGANCTYTTMNIAASRGCFGDCGFCFISRFYGCSNRRTRTAFSFERELELRKTRRDITHLYFIDPAFIGYGAEEKERVKTIGEIVEGAGIPFGFETRVDTFDEKLIAALAKNGLTSVFLGVESGCDAALHRMNKQVTKQQIVRAVRCIQDNGINLNAGFIMFEPDTTLAELRENFAFLEELGLLSCHEFTINMLYHSQIVLNGSKAWKRLGEQGRLVVDERRPFEAEFLFQHDDVAQVCTAMKGLATEYFWAMNGRNGKQRGCNASNSDLNLLLKDAFSTLISNAEKGRRQLADLEKYREKLRLLITGETAQVTNESSGPGRSGS